MASTKLNPATRKRHLSLEFNEEQERSPGSYAMRKLEDGRLKATTEEYEEKAHLIEGERTRKLVERLGEIGRDEIEKRERERLVFG